MTPEIKQQADALTMEAAVKCAMETGMYDPEQFPSETAKVVHGFYMTISDTLHLPELLALEEAVRRTKSMKTITYELEQVLTNLDAAKRKDGV